MKAAIYRYMSRHRDIFYVPCLNRDGPRRTNIEINNILKRFHLNPTLQKEVTEIIRTFQQHLMREGFLPDRLTKKFDEDDNVWSSSTDESSSTNEPQRIVKRGKKRNRSGTNDEPNESSDSEDGLLKKNPKKQKTADLSSERRKKLKPNDKSKVNISGDDNSVKGNAADLPNNSNDTGKSEKQKKSKTDNESHESSGDNLLIKTTTKKLAAETNKKQKKTVKFNLKPVESEDTFMKPVEYFDLDEYYVNIRDKNIPEQNAYEQSDEPNKDIGQKRKNLQSIGQQIKKQIEELRRRDHKDKDFKVRYKHTVSSNELGTAKRTKCKPNGNCLFEAILYQKQLGAVDDNQLKDFRQKICEYLRKKVFSFEKLQEFTLDRLSGNHLSDFNDQSEDKQKFIVKELFKHCLSELENNYSWGSYETLYAAANLFKANILVINENHYPILRCFKNEFRQTYVICHVSNFTHYDSIIDIKDEDIDKIANYLKDLNNESGKSCMPKKSCLKKDKPSKKHIASDVENCSPNVLPSPPIIDPLIQELFDLANGKPITDFEHTLKLLKRFNNVYHSGYTQKISETKKHFSSTPTPNSNSENLPWSAELKTIETMTTTFDLSKKGDETTLTKKDVNLEDKTVDVSVPDYITKDQLTRVLEEVQTKLDIGSCMKSRPQ